MLNVTSSALSLFLTHRHLAIPPKSEQALHIRNDIQITNASFAPILADATPETGRTVITIKFEAVNPRVFDSDTESDSDDEEISEDEDDEEDLPEEAKGAAVAKASAAGKAKAAVGGEDDSDSEDSVDLGEIEQPVELALAALSPGRIEGINLNVVLTKYGDEVVLFQNHGPK